MSDQNITVEALLASNNEKLSKLYAADRRIDSSSFIGLRFETFLETFLSPEDRGTFELNYQIRLGEKLDEALRNIARETLQAGVRNVNPRKLIV